MSEPSPQQAAKPGTACLGCRRRKLKCTRETEGCSNCIKADLPCVYPAPETGIKRKRGPYKKDKPARERHLEDLVKYLEPKTADGESATGDCYDLAREEDHSPSSVSATNHDASTSFMTGNAAERKTSNSEDLVKDALIALTRSSVSERDGGVIDSVPTIALPVTTSNATGYFGLHPPVRQILEYWQLFMRRVDPLLKIIHTRTFEKTLFKVVDNLQTVHPVTESLLFSIYYAAVGSCTDRQTRKRFGENREVLMQRYGRVVGSALADSYSMPVLESLQALVIYIISLRRDDSVGNIRALFSLAVRMAQMLGLHEDPNDAFSPFETEYRRRLWWHICGLESRGAEEGGARHSSIMEHNNVQLPSNLNDVDLDPDIRDSPKPRTGVTDVTFVLLRWESVRMIQGLMEVKKRHKTKTQKFDAVELKVEQKYVWDQSRARIETYYQRHLHDSRAYDWLCLRWIELMMIKSRLIVEFQFGPVPTNDMSAAARIDLLQSSVDIIRITHAVTVHKQVEDWKWYFRGWVQWHSIAIVIAELGGNKNRQFVNTAWAVLDPILDGWDKVYKIKRDEPAWQHVNTLIERARQMRRVMPPQRQTTQQTQAPSHISITAIAPTSSFKLDDHLSNTGGVTVVRQGDSRTPFNISATGGQEFQDPHFNPEQLSGQSIGAMSVFSPFQTGCAPEMQGMENVDFGYIEGLDSIDFSAFDAVFGDTTWEFSSPSTDQYLEGTIP